MRPLLVFVALATTSCFDEAPPVDDDDDGGAAEDDAPADESSSDDGDASSSGGEPVDPLDAYGPCELDSDCELVPGDNGDIGDSVRCVLGTCAIRCADEGAQACPGHLEYSKDEPGFVAPFGCNDDGYCTVVYDPAKPPGSGCPEGMGHGDVETVPDLACVWPQD